MSPQDSGPSADAKPLSLPSVCVRFGLGLVWGLLWLAPTLLLALLLIPSRVARIRLGNFYAKVVGFTVVRLMGTRWVVHGRENLGRVQAIYVANHTSGIDFFLGAAVCPFGGCGTAKKEIVKTPVFGIAYLLSGHLLIDRGDSEKSHAAMRALGDLARRKALSIWIWPEGTRSMDGRPLPFKKGFVHVACATRLPVVPIVMHGARERWRPKTVRFTPGVIDIEVLPPIDTSGWRPERAAEHAEAVRQVFCERLSTG